MINNLYYGLPAALMGASAMVLVAPETAAALSPTEVGQIAQQITVLIQTRYASGSGIIVARDGNTYTIVTNEHVIRDATRGEEVYLTTYDNQQHRVLANTIKIVPGVDMATLELVSDRDYLVAEMGDSAGAIAGSKVYVSGYPVITISITRSIYTFTEGKITANASQPLADGYSLVYSNSTLPGMSGGPVLNEDGALIGVHGRADIERSTTKATGNPNVRIKTGFNLGIPIHIYLGWADTGPTSGGNTVPTVTPKPGTQPKADDFLLQAGDKYKQGDYEGAIRDLDRAISLNPNYAYAYTNRGVAKANLGQVEEAIADYNKALELDSNLASTYNNRGVLRLNLGNRTDAMADFDAALRLNPKLLQAYNNRGKARSLQGDLSGAIQDYSEAIALNPNVAEVFNNRGNARSLQGDLSEAIKDYNEAIGLDPNLADAYYNRALAKSDLGQKEQAIADYSQAVALNNGYWQAMNNIGLIKYEMGQRQEAVQQWQQAVTVAANELEPRFALAVALYSQGNQDQSISMSRKVLQSDKRYGDLEFLRTHLWGDRLLEDTRKLLEDPEIKGVLENSNLW